MRTIARRAAPWPLGLAGTLALAACGGERPPGFAAANPDGAALVVGTDLHEWGLLAVPRAGGPATLRPVDEPGRIVWTSDVDLPASASAHIVADAVIVLRSADGTLYRYDPAADAVERVGEADPESMWHGFGAGAVLVDSAAGAVHHFSRGGTWRYRVPHPVLWAAPVDEGGVAVLLATESGSELWVVRSGEERPGETLPDPGQPPGLVTAWGRRIVLSDPADGRGGLRLITVSPLGLASRYEVPGRLRALAVSPSSHEVYAVLEDPAALVAVNRFSGSRRVLARPSSPPLALRTSPFGGSLLLRTAGGVRLVPVAGEGGVPVRSEWRPDLPLALPGGRVLAIDDGKVQLLSPGSAGGARVLDAPADAWWLPVRWRPVPAGVLAGRVDGEPVGTGVADAEGAGRERARDAAGARDPRAAEPPREGARGARAAGDGGAAAREHGAGEEAFAGAGDDGFGDFEGAAFGEGGAGERADGAREGPPPPPSGFYAIVVSARSAGGVVDLVRSLSADGYPTAIQTVSDDAGQEWHRGLVGPYAGRPQAEAAARALARERDLRSWVTEIGGP